MTSPSLELRIISFSTVNDYDVFLSKLSLAQVQRIDDWLDPAAFLGFMASGRRLTNEDMFAIRHAASNPQLDGSVLTLLYKYALQFPDPAAAVQVVSHPHLPESVLEEATSLWRRQVWVEQKGYSETVSAVALANPSLHDPLGVFLQNIKETTWATTPLPQPNSYSSNSFKAARRRRKPEGWLNEDLYIQAILRSDISTSPAVLSALMELSTQQSLLSGYNPYEWIPEGIVAHPNCDGSALLTLYTAWETHENTRGVSIIPSPLTRFILSMMAKDSCPPELLSKACWSSNVKVRQIAAQHPACPEEDAVAAVLLPGGEGNLFF